MKLIILQTLGQKCIIKMNGNGHSEKDGIFIMPSLEASVWCILFTELTEKCEINGANQDKLIVTWFSGLLNQ